MTILKLIKLLFTSRKTKKHRHLYNKLFKFVQHINMKTTQFHMFGILKIINNTIIINLTNKIIYNIKKNITTYPYLIRLYGIM